MVRKLKSTQICSDDDGRRRIRRMEGFTLCGIGRFVLSHSIIRVKKSRRV